MRVPRLSLTLMVMAVFLLALSPASGQQYYPARGTVSIEITGVAAGVGVSWGSGTLSFAGKRYPFRIRGVSVGGRGHLQGPGRGHGL